MHDEMLTLFDDCIERMLQLRAHLSASRRVQPGERLATVVDAIEVTARFAAEAGRTVAHDGAPVTPYPQATPYPQTGSYSIAAGGLDAAATGWPTLTRAS